MIPLLMRLHLMPLSLLLALALASCGRPSQAQLDAQKEPMLPVISFLDSYVESGRALPDDLKGLQKAYKDATKQAFPPEVFYCPVDKKIYTVWIYIPWHNRLLFFSQNNAGIERGWLYDDD